MKHTLTFLSTLLLAVVAVQAQEPVSFSREIRPIL